jgi:hypothetical protein
MHWMSAFLQFEHVSALSHLTLRAAQVVQACLLAVGVVDAIVSDVEHTSYAQ